MAPLVLAAAACLAGFVQGAAGFGSTLVAMPMLAWVLDAHTAVPVGCLMALVINVAQSAWLRRHVRGRALSGLLLASLPGMALGAWVLDAGPDAVLKAVLGGAVMVFAAYVLRSPGPVRPAGPGWCAAAGMVAGCFGVCIGINGPPIVAWTVRQRWSPDEFKATLAAYFLAAGAVIVGVQAWHGFVTGHVLWLSALAAPGVGLGLVLGRACAARLDERRFRLVVALLLLASGAVLLLRSVAGQA